MSPATPLFAGTARRCLWALRLALLLALFGALAPTVSRALNSARGDGANWVEMCTSTGPRWMALGPAGKVLTTVMADAASAVPSEAPPTVAAGDACPFCLLNVDRAAPPPQTSAHCFSVPGMSPAPLNLQLRFRPVFSSPVPPPRGPPSAL